MLVELADGGIEEIESDCWHSNGCETCDYGSSYVKEFVITMTKFKILIKSKQMYEYAMSDDFTTKLFIQNLEEIKTLTEEQFFVWIKNAVNKSIEINDLRDTEIECSKTVS